MSKVAPSLIKDPAALYATLLESGMHPAEAYQTAFEATEADPPEDPDSVFAARLMAGMGVLEAHEEAYGDGIGPDPIPPMFALVDYTPPGGFVVPADDTHPAVLAWRMSAVPGGGAISSSPSEASLAGRYQTWVYRLRYYLSLDDTTPYTTFLRINIPATVLSGASYVGVVFMVDGWKGEKALEASVRALEAKTTLYLPMTALASGLTYDEAVDIGGDFAPGLLFRKADPMVTIGFSQPGRGVEMPTSGDPDFMDSIPENMSGMDYGGALTLACMDAVWRAASTVIQNWLSAIELDVETRLVVLSESGGLTPAACWIAKCTPGEVHGFVDWEGPADSFDRVSTAGLLQPPDVVDPVSSDYEDAFGWPPEGYFDSYDTWYALWSGTEDWFFFRPPLQFFPDSDSTWLPETGGMLTTEMTDLRTTPLHRVCFRYWRSAYGAFAYDRATTLASLQDFWTTREAVYGLPSLATQTCIYVRIQTLRGHGWDSTSAPDGLTDWLNGYEGMKALDSAFASGANPNVYYTDAGFMKNMDKEDHDEDWYNELAQDPTNYTASLDRTDTSIWREVTLDRDVEKWAAMVDLVRWVMTASAA